MSDRGELEIVILGCGSSGGVSVSGISRNTTVMARRGSESASARSSAVSNENSRISAP